MIVIDYRQLLDKIDNPPYTLYSADDRAAWLDECIATVHTFDAEPMKHGRWIENSDPGQNINEHYMCSECGCTFHNWANDNYCPNCGSKNRMDGDEE